MKIEVLVIGCAKCKRLERNVEQALKELGLDNEIVRITDIEEMKKRGVMRVPVLFLDGVVVSVGSVPSVEELKAMLSREKVDSTA
jgi:small redox-active disulfide protein 2